MHLASLSVGIAAEGQRTAWVSLPFYWWQLTAPKPIHGYPEECEHIGHHLLERRLDLGIEQKRARILGTNAWSLRNWETGRHRVELRFYPKIIKFLGFNPLPEPSTLGQAVPP